MCTLKQRMVLQRWWIMAVCYLWYPSCSPQTLRCRSRLLRPLAKWSFPVTRTAHGFALQPANVNKSELKLRCGVHVCSFLQRDPRGTGMNLYNAAALPSLWANRFCCPRTKGSSCWSWAFSSLWPSMVCLFVCLFVSKYLKYPWLTCILTFFHFTFHPCRWHEGAFTWRRNRW